MPTPLEILLDPISLIVLSMYAALFIWENLLPGRDLPRIRFWKLRGVTMFFIFFFLSTYLPLLWDGYLARFQVIDLTGLPVWAGALAGLLLYELGGYIWHRSMHRFDFLWKTFHQMHHSAERLDIPSAFYFSPLDMLGWTFLSSFSLVLLVGLTPEAATLAILSITFLGMFQHSNIKTPQWLGYIVQRPESHTVHHGKGIHGYNYADLPIIDIIFGTFRNPKFFENETGFYDGASGRIGDMLVFKDVSKQEDSTLSVSQKINQA